MIGKFAVLFLVYFVHEISGHGMMLDPPGRSSLWRINGTAPINYQDNQNYCGGAWVQNGLNDGNCGVCGDSYTDAHPQDNENTGKYGVGIIAEYHKPGDVIEVGILLTANHLGSFTYHICQLEDPNAPESGEECFQHVPLADGSESYLVTENDIVVVNKIQLPDIECPRCVLRWTYKAGNNWGECDDGIWRAGCGPQEHFRSCADISISSANGQSE